jgi:uncharacterized protein YkwD
MKAFFSVYLVLLVSVFALWAIEPLRAEQEKLATQIETEILLQVDELRKAEGRMTFIPDDLLSSIAHAHSFDMLSLEYFSHQDKHGCNSYCRLTKTRQTVVSSGENIYTASTYTKDPVTMARTVVVEWMHNKERRANLLSTYFTHTGIGVALSGEGLYVTQDFVERESTP